MNLQEFRIGWRLLKQHPSHSFIVIMGLAVGFAVCFLLLSYVYYSFNHDAWVADHDRVYLVKTQFNYAGTEGPWRQTAPFPLVAALEKSGQGVSASNFYDVKRTLKANNALHEVHLTMVNPQIQEVFGLKAMEGDLNNALSRPDTMAFTEAMAEKLFGDRHAVGKKVDINGKLFTVAAVIKTPPATTTFNFSILVGINTDAMSEEARQMSAASWGLLNGHVFVKLGPNTSPQSITQAIQNMVDSSPLPKSFPPALFATLGSKRLMELRLCALRDVYLDPDISGNEGDIPHGNKVILLTLAFIGLLILALAAINYINLATVRTLRRQREIAIRKIMGASVARVIRQFLAESILVALLATVAGLLLAAVAQPIFAELVNRSLDDLFTPASVLLSLLLGLLLGVLTGAYPIWVALHVRPIQALSGRGNSETAGGLWVRRVLTVLQFSTAMGLCAVGVTITWQTVYLTHLDPGFDPKPLLVIELKRNMNEPHNKAFIDELKRTSGVTDVAVAADPIGRHDTHLVLFANRVGQPEVSMEMKGVSADFFKTYGIRARVGRLFDVKTDTEESLICVLNATATSALGFATPEAATGQFIHVRGEAKPIQIIGIAAEIRSQSLRKPPEPQFYTISSDINFLTVRANGNLTEVQTTVEGIWNRHFPNYILHMTRAQTFFDNEYGDDLRMSKIMGYGTAIAILIAAFGIYVLSAYSIQRRSKELVLRKLFGAGQRAIAFLVSKEFATLILISAVIGLPVASIAASRYLSDFVERAPFGVWPLVFSFLLAAVIAFLSTLRHTLSALRISPAQVLQNQE
jgi:putative ABC transport system permease protein